ncbi:MAG: SusC/RagA family TonB-linked outer membrane protein [Chryseolinea sp.]
MKKLLLACLALAFAGSVVAQDRPLTGKVTSTEDGSPLPGVNVIVKGTTNGAVTDADGGYTLSVPESANELVFSFIGLKTEEVSIAGRSTVDVQLTMDITQLSEIVVTGVGVATDKRKLGISVESITSRELPATPTASIDQALIGKIAGAQISSTNGTPGADVNIVLRGINTINRGTAPIVLIDGIQVASTNLNTIDLNTIDRVEVVQGAAAATIYGAQGANGVIQLFSKKGKAGKLNIDFSSSFANNTYLNIGDVRKSRFHAFATDADNNVIGTSGNPLVLDPETLLYSENVQYSPLSVTSVANKPYDRNLQYYDHFDYFFKPANTFNNSVSISGGKEKVDFAFSASNNHQESNIIENGSVSRSNFSSNVGFELAKGLTFRTITQLAYTKNTIKSQDRTIMFSVNNARPFANFDQLDSDGDVGVYFGDAVGVNHFNPLYYQRYTNVKDNKIDVIQNFNLNYKFPKFVELDAKYGLNYQQQEQITIYPNQTQNNNANSQNYVSNWATDDRGEIDNYAFYKSFQNFLGTAIVRFDFQKDFDMEFPLVATTQIGYDVRKTKNRQYLTYGLGLPTFSPFTTSQATTTVVPAANTTSYNKNDPEYYGGDYTEEYFTYGYLVNQRLEFGEFAGVSGGFRSDYSSSFGKGSKPFTFPRADAYLRLSQLGFWKDASIASIIPEFKLRAAYGEAGIQPKPFDRYLTMGTKSLGETTAIYGVSNKPNPDLEVEVSRELEVGTDIAFTANQSSSWLNDIGVSFSYWKRSTDNAIYDIDDAPSKGYGTLKDNAFGLESEGIQAALTFQVFTGSSFNWNLTANFSKQSSEIVSTSGSEIVVLSSAGSTNYILKPGEKIGQLYGRLALHQVDALGPDGNPFIAPASQANFTVASNGYVVSKATKQPFFTSGLYSFGDPNPDFNMSFINDMTYKDFLTFSFQFDWVEGSHLYNQTKEWMYRDGIHSDYEKPITIEGETGAYTAFYRGVYAQRQANGTKDYFYEDASFVRLRNVAVGLDLAKIFKMNAFRKLQLLASGRNLLTFTDYTGMDPEVSSGSSNSSFDRGVDHNTMPNYKSYQVGLNIGF